MAFPTLPELPVVPDVVDLDRWLRVNVGLHLVRLVRSDGTVRVDLKSYYVGRVLTGRWVALHMSTTKKSLLVVDGHQLITTSHGSGLSGQAVRFEAFVRFMMDQARAEHRLRTPQERRARLGDMPLLRATMWGPSSGHEVGNQYRTFSLFIIKCFLYRS